MSELHRLTAADKEIILDWARKFGGLPNAKNLTSDIKEAWLVKSRKKPSRVVRQSKGGTELEPSRRIEILCYQCGNLHSMLVSPILRQPGVITTYEINCFESPKTAYRYTDKLVRMKWEVDLIPMKNDPTKQTKQTKGTNDETD